MPLKKKKKVVVKKKAVKKSPTKKKAVKKKIVKKAAGKKPALKKRAPAKALPGTVVGKITHYFPKVRVGVLKLKVPLSVGDSLRIKGHTSDFKQAVTSMQEEHVVLTQAKKGQEIGLLVESRVRRGDTVYKL